MHLFLQQTSSFTVTFDGRSDEGPDKDLNPGPLDK